MKEKEELVLERAMTILTHLSVGKFSVLLATEIPLILNQLNLRPNDLEFAEWISEVDDHLVLESMMDLIMNHDDSDYKAYNPEVRSFLSGIGQILEIICSSDQFKQIRLIDTTLLVMVQDWLQRKILALNSSGMDHFIRFYSDCSIGNSLGTYENSDNIFNYFINYSKLT